MSVVNDAEMSMSVLIFCLGFFCFFVFLFFFNCSWENIPFKEVVTTSPGVL